MANSRFVSCSDKFSLAQERNRLNITFLAVIAKLPIMQAVNLTAHVLCGNKIVSKLILWMSMNEVGMRTILCRIGKRFYDDFSRAVTIDLTDDSSFLSCSRLGIPR